MSDPLTDVIRKALVEQERMWPRADPVADAVRAHLAAVLDAKYRALDAKYRALEDEADSTPSEERWDRLSREMTTVREVKELLLAEKEDE